MLVLTSSGTPDYYPLAENLERRLQELHEHYLIFDLIGGYSRGIPVSPLLGYQPIRRRDYTRAKALCMQSIQEVSKQQLLWMDTDCYPTGPIPELGNYDFGLYLRKKKGGATVKVDVVMIGNTPAARWLLKHYTSQPKSTRSDRTWLQQTIEKFTKLTPEIADQECFQVGPARVRVLSELYSYDVSSPDQKIPKDVKILHFKTDDPQRKLAHVHIYCQQQKI